MGSDGDMSMDLSKCRSIVDDHNRLYVEKCKLRQERECTLLVNSIAPILKRRAVDSASNDHKSLIEKCLRCIRESQDLIADLNTNAESKVASPMASSAMSSELEMLDNKTSDSSKNRKLRDKHLKLLYDVLKKDKNETIQKFFQVCEEEQGAFVVNSVLRKLLRIFLRLDTAKSTTKGRLSSHNKIARINQKLKELVRKINDQLHKDSLQGSPNSECSICFLGFSLDRKRACISPCGHASTCFDCAKHAYKRTKTCPLCRCGMEEPVPLPGKLYF